MIEKKKRHMWCLLHDWVGNYHLVVWVTQANGQRTRGTFYRLHTCGQSHKVTVSTVARKTWKEKEIEEVEIIAVWKRCTLCFGINFIYVLKSLLLSRRWHLLKHKKTKKTHQENSREFNRSRTDSHTKKEGLCDRNFPTRCQFLFFFSETNSLNLLNLILSQLKSQRSSSSGHAAHSGWSDGK